jgi:hypothetical protein
MTHTTPPADTAAPQSEQAALTGGSNRLHAGASTCPICSRLWIVTPHDDCCLPACDCYGSDTSAANPNRPCYSCGVGHAWSCPTLQKIADSITATR